MATYIKPHFVSGKTVDSVEISDNRQEVFVRFSDGTSLWIAEHPLQGGLVVLPQPVESAEAA